MIDPKWVNIVEGITNMTSFHTFLVEQDQDFEYKLCSVKNIHSSETMAQMRLALGRYGLISIEPNGIQTQVATGSHQFTAYPFLPVYVCKVIMANPVSSRPLVQTISLYTNIKEGELRWLSPDDKIVMDGADAQQHAHAIEVPSDQAQSEVGDRHATSLVSDLMKDIAANRAANTVERPVHEGYVASHHEISSMLSRNVRRGFYLVENESATVGVVTGPFRKCPDNYDYIKTVPVATSVTESSNDGVTEYQVEYSPTAMQDDPSDAGQRVRGKSVQVTVVDQDTGKEHHVVVRAESNTSARLRAVEIIAQRTGLAKDRFIPIHPEPEPGN